MTYNETRSEAIETCARLLDGERIGTATASFLTERGSCLITLTIDERYESMTDIMKYVATVRELVEELNASAASGLITRDALIMLSGVDRETRTLERELEDAKRAEQDAKIRK